MENRIKEQQLALFADRTSTHEMRSNQLRLYFSSFAYVLIQTQVHWLKHKHQNHAHRVRSHLVNRQYGFSPGCEKCRLGPR